MDRNETGQATCGEMRRAVEKIGWRKTGVLELFSCLDVQRSGTIEYGEFLIAKILSGWFKLELVSRCQEFLNARYKDLRAAYRDMDDNRSGAMTLREWSDKFKELGYPLEHEEDVSTTFHFLDVDRSEIIRPEEFALLTNFDLDSFMSSLARFHDRLVEVFGSLDKAFDTFDDGSDGNPGGGMRSGFGGAHVQLGSSKGAREVNEDARALTRKEFSEAWHRYFSSVPGEELSVAPKGRPTTPGSGRRAARDKEEDTIDYRLVFNFLDLHNTGKVTREAFGTLGKLAAVNDMKKHGEQLAEALEKVRRLAVINGADSSGPLGQKLDALYDAILDRAARSTAAAPE